MSSGLLVHRATLDGGTEGITCVHFSQTVSWTGFNLPRWADLTFALCSGSRPPGSLLRQVGAVVAEGQRYAQGTAPPDSASAHPPQTPPPLVPVCE